MRFLYRALQLTELFHTYVTLSSQQPHRGHNKYYYYRSTDEAMELRELGTCSKSHINKVWGQDLMPDLLTPNLVQLPPYLATSLHLQDYGVYEIYFDIS